MTRQAVVAGMAVMLSVCAGIHINSGAEVFEWQPADR